jgi:alpha-tubulin suppressor-like RCC1 family protein
MLFSQPLTGFQFLILPDIAAGISSYYLWGWGANSLRELGISDATNRSSPVLINSQGIWTAVFAGKSETSHIFNISDEYYLWGENGFGKLGTGDTTNRSSPTSTLLGLSGWADISAGDGFTIGVRTDGKMYAFGYNLYGKLGDGTTTNRSSPVTVLSGGSDTWSKISCGQNSSAAIKTDGSLWTWGNGASGELGNGGGAGYSSNSPKTITGGSSGWSQVSTGFTHCIAIKTDGSLWSWGTNSYGELGDNTTTSRTSPVTVLSGGSNTWSKISCGQNFSAAIKTDGTLWTWGRDHYGQLGDGTTSRAQSKTSPGTIAGAGTNWSIIKCGNANCAAIKTDGSLWTWGWGNSGRLGHSSSASRSSPGTVTGAGNTWVNVAAGYGHVLALRQYDIPAVVTAYTAHWAWGSNAYYTFGENRTSQITSSKASPIAIPYNLPWISLSAGRIHAAGIDESGTLWSWGYNNQGQLGNGTTDFNALITSPVGGGTWQQVSCGRDWTMGLKTDGAAWTWGYNISGALGNGTAGATSGKSSPVSVLGGHTFSYINCGYRHGGGITTGGRLYLWGSNDYGELGFNPTSPSTAYSILSPISCTNFTDWTSISLGRFYSAGIANGTLYTWGNNSKGQLGDGTTTSRSSPVSISSGWSQI